MISAAEISLPANHSLFPNSLSRKSKFNLIWGLVKASSVFCTICLTIGLMKKGTFANNIKNVRKKKEKDICK